MVTGTSYIPTEAYIYFSITVVKMDGKKSLVITDHPEAKAADANGSTRNVKGGGTLNVHIVSDHTMMSHDTVPQSAPPSFDDSLT